MFRIVQLQKKERMNQSAKQTMHKSTQIRDYSFVSLLQRDGRGRTEQRYVGPYRRTWNCDTGDGRAIWVRIVNHEAQTGQTSMDLAFGSLCREAV